MKSQIAAMFVYTMAWLTGYYVHSVRPTLIPLVVSLVIWMLILLFLYRE